MPTPLRVLIIEDSPDDAELMILHLTKGGFQPEWQRVETEPDFLAALGADLDMILADWSLPNFSGLRALQLMNERGLDIPFIIVSGSIGEESAIGALRLGASDYMLKDRPLRLGPAVQGALEGKRLRQERKQAEEALCESEEKYRSLVERANDGITIIQDGVVKFANTRVMEMWGGTVEEVLETPFANYIHPDQLPALVERYQQRMAGEEVSPMYETVLLRSDGSKVYVEINAGVIAYLGKPADLVMVRDVTERKRAEEELENARTTLDAAFEQTPIPMVLVSMPDAVLRIANSAYREILGIMDEPEVVGQRLVDFKPPYLDYDAQGKLTSLTEAPLTLALQGKRILNQERRIVTKDGTTHWVLVSGNPIYNTHGDLIAAYLVFPDITEGKRIEKALRQSEEKYRELIDGMNETVWVIDFNGNLIDVNKTAVEVLGYSKEELLTVGLYGIDSSLRKEDIIALANTMPLDKVQIFETAHTTKDGRTFPVEVYSSLVTYQGKRAILSIARDITERMQAEKALRESEKELKEAQLLGRVGNWEYDLESQKITWSDQTYRLYERDPILGPPTAEEEATYYSPEQAQTLHEYARRAVEEGQEFDYDLEATLPSGKRVYFSAKMRPVKDARGRIVKLFGTVQDITERKRIEELLVKERQELKLIIDTSPIIVFYKDKEGRFVRVNKTFAETLKMPVEDFVGKTVFDLYPPEIAQGMADDDQEVFESGHAKLNIIEQHESASGIRWVQTDKFPICDENGIPFGLIGFAQDITERKKAEEALGLRMEQLVAINQASQAVATSLDLDQVLTEIMSLAGKVAASDFASVVLVDEAGLISKGIENLPGIPSIEIRIRGKGFTRWIVRSHRPAVADEIGEDGLIRPRVGGGAPRSANPNLVARGIKSFVGLPLMVKDHIVGVLYLHSLRPGVFGDQLPLLTTFANQAAIAIEKARLYDAVQKELAERKRAEDELQRERDTAQQYLDIAGVLMAALDTDGQITLINQKGCELLGYKESELIGRNWFDTCLSEDAREEVRGVIERLMAGDVEPVEYYENAVLTKSGEQRILAFHNSVIQDQNSQTAGILFSGEDITERKRAEAELQASREAERDFAERLTILSETTTELSKAENLDALCRRAVELGRERLNFDRPSIWFITEDCTAILGTFGVDAEGQITDERGDSYPVTPDFDTWPVLKGQVPLLCLTDSPLWLKGQVVGQGTHVVAGLWDGNTVIGYVSVDNQLRHQPISDRDCEIIHLYASAVGHLVSLQRAQEELRTSEERFAKSFQSNPIATIVDILPEGRILDVNETFLRLTGYSREDVIGKTGLELGLWADPEERIRLARALIAQESIRDVEGRLLTKSGDSRDMLASVENIQIAGQPHGLIMLVDITERKRAEEALGAERNLLRTLINNLPDAIYAKDLRGCKTLVNRADLDNIGRPEAEVLGKTDAELFSPQIAAQFEADDQKVLQSGQPVLNREERLVNHKGKQIWQLTSKLPLKDAAGQIVGLVGVGHDITERKQVEEALARQAEELRQRNEELARLYRASGSLISGVSLNLQELAQKIVEVVQQEFGQSNCSLLVVQKDANELVRLVASGSYAEQVEYQNLALDGPGLIPLAIRTNKVVNVGDVHSAPDYVQGWDAAQSELAIPLKVGSSVIGVIDVQSSQPNAFSPDDERLMTVFAERAALALEHGRLNAQTEARLQQLTALRTVDMAISSSFDINLTLGVLLDQVTGQLGVHAADILAFNATTQTFKFACERGFRTQMLQRTQFKFGVGYAWRAIRERRVIVVPDIQVEPDGLQRSPDLSGEQFVAYLGMPLIAKGQIKGVLEVFHREPFTLEKEWFGFLEMLAGQAAIAIDNAELFDHLQRSNADLTMAYDSTLEGWASALEMRDKDTEGHTRRVTELTVQLARALGVKENDMVHIYRGALLHDIGKVGVPDSIVLKPGPLTEDEWAIMRKHPQYAYDMLSPIAYLRLALDIPYCHHEKWDGTGYPRGLKGEQIPLAARIFAVIDVWDALISDRPYRKAWPKAKARQYIQEQAGLYFDPQVVRAFLNESFKKG